MNLFKSYGPFPCAVFLGAFLLFQIQPIIGKYFLPWFGGAPAVWLTCLMFFQLLLLGGYAYAHFLQRLRTGTQIAVHLAFLAVALLIGAFLAWGWGAPLLPDLSWRPESAEHPTPQVLKLLWVSIGPAYFLLSTSASLLQAWFHRCKPKSSPYIFYVVSNLASLLALLSYPVFVEPYLTLHQQAWVWSGGFAVYTLFCVTCMAQVWKSNRTSAPEVHTKIDKHSKATTPTRRAYLHWTLLAFCGVLALMAVTHQMTQDIPPVPFLWILPLALYLLSYMIGFMERMHNGQDLCIYLLLCAFGIVWYLAKAGLELDIRHQIAAYSFILLAICLFCHNALYRTRPDPKHLTGFYLCLSLGGALGGSFCVLAAPLLFKGGWEYPLALLLSGGLAIQSIYTDSRARPTFRPIRHLFPALLVGFAVFLGVGILKDVRRAVYMERNFFGSLQVVLEYNNGVPIYSLLHGKINHGMQIHHPKFRTRATTYFTESSGVGRAIGLLQQEKESLHIGVIGLGIGTLAAYGRPADTFRMYEIDPEVIRLAENSPWFSYLPDSKAKITVVPGDGRRSLEEEWTRGTSTTPPQAGNHFDLLVLDAFSGDSPPAHLLTLEAFNLYLQHLNEDGVIAVNISNRYLDLLPILMQVRDHFGLHAAYIQSTGNMKTSANAQWTIFSKNPEFINEPALSKENLLKGQTIRSVRPWTDDYSNLLHVIK